MDETTDVAVTQFLRSEGSIVLFQGIDEDGHEVTFAAEARYGHEINAAIERGEDVVAAVPDHMFWGVLMSYYKDEPAPEKCTVGERLDQVAPRFFEPTYERKDFKSRWPEAVVIIFALVIGIWLSLTFAGWADGVYPTSIPAPYVTPTQEPFTPDPGTVFVEPSTPPTSSGD